MASKVPAWGIDVGQCSLKAMKLAVSGEGVELQAFDVVEHESILSEAGADATAQIIKSIETFVGRNNFKGSQVVVSVPGQQTLTRFTKMPPVEAKKIPDMVQYEASQQIPFDMDEVVWDYQVFTEKDSPDVEVGIFAIRKELIRNYLMNFTERGLEPIIVQTSPMASYNAARFESTDWGAHATVLLDMGALATDLIIAEGNRIWSRPVPIGGNRFTEALVSAFKISFKKAEKLKRTAATSKYARQIFAAMRPIFADLVSEVQRSIGFYTSTHREAHITRVLGMGNAFKLPGLQKFLQQNLQLDVDRLTGFKRMAASEAASSPAFTENVMSFAVAYGLAVQGLGLAAVQSNLLPLEIRKTLLWRRKQPWFAASAASLALAAGSIWVGNVMARGEISRAMGNLPDVRVPPVRLEDADRILSSPPGDAFVEYGSRVAGAVKALQKEMADTERLRAGDQDLFERMVQVTQNNIFVPRLLHLVHRAIAGSVPPEIVQAKSLADYLDLTRRIPRASRREVWIDALQMIYDPRDASKLFAGDQKKSSGPGKAGWGLRLTCVTTDPQPAQWIENTLMPTLTKIGREPGRGIYVESVSLERVVKRSEAARARGQAFAGQQTAAGRGDGRGAPTPVGRDEGRDSVGRMGVSPGDPSAERGGSTRNQLARWRQRLENKDPLTLEDTSDDQVFVLNVVVFKGDTPQNLIPDEYKQKQPEPAKKP